ncbi:uncharacterized protein LOC143422915 [Xylocopa sonorina]|uniref:uncharacterized protein LOC143422915 n=1 Tax=Xylocopa sonorina TaxID=1818115 RepID=UPI00403B0986
MSSPTGDSSGRLDFGVASTPWYQRFSLTHVDKRGHAFMLRRRTSRPRDLRAVVCTWCASTLAHVRRIGTRQGHHRSGEDSRWKITITRMEKKYRNCPGKSGGRSKKRRWKKREFLDAVKEREESKGSSTPWALWSTLDSRGRWREGGSWPAKKRKKPFTPRNDTRNIALYTGNVRNSYANRRFEEPPGLEYVNPKCDNAELI